MRVGVSSGDEAIRDGGVEFWGGAAWNAWEHLGLGRK